MVVAEFSVVPIKEQSLRPFVRIALGELEKSGLKFEVGAMGTTVEGELDQVLEAVKNAHRAVLAAGAGRVITSIKIDDRESGVSMEGKLEGLR
jgi:uncharacterized protein (TIGR00106 family)